MSCGYDRVCAGGSLWWRPLCATTGPLCVWANAGQGGRADATRRGRRGYFARRAVGGVWAGPWRGGCGPMRCPAATRAALPCGRECRGRGISRRNSSEVKSRIPKPAARRRAKYPRRPRRGARRGVRQPSRARAWGAERARGTRAPTNVGVLVRQGQRGGPCGRHAPGAARVLRAPGRGGANVGAHSDATRRGRRGYFARRAVVGPTSGSLCARANPRGGPRADVPRRGWCGYTPGERSCTGVIETRNRSAWATLRFGANKFNHLSICAREGPLTGFLSFFYFF